MSEKGKAVFEEILAEEKERRSKHNKKKGKEEPS
jgi:hypothetical protein